MNPKRVQRKRAKGWSMPAGAIYVGRPTRWGNPFVVGEGSVAASGAMAGSCVGWYDPGDVRHYDIPFGRGLTAAEAVWLYRDDLVANLEDDDPECDELRKALPALAGHDLVCWCPLGQPCHADVLLELANR